MTRSLEDLRKDLTYRLASAKGASMDRMPLLLDEVQQLVDELKPVYEYNTAREDRDGELWDIQDYLWTDDVKNAYQDQREWYEEGYDPEDDPLIIIRRPVYPTPKIEELP